MINERPIIFSGPMVRAILDGRKTQTRRVLRRPENYGCPTGDCPHETREQCNAAMNAREVIHACPYGREGDRLWIRETWFPIFGGRAGQSVCLYRADDPGAHLNPSPRPVGGWRSPIFMPRWASRCVVEIRGIRLEWLQAISEDDAIAEGITPGDIPHRATFANLWDQINGTHGARSFRWSANPWVWVLRFFRL